MKKLPLYQLQEKLGTKIGQTLYNFSRGIDDRPLLTNQLRQSVSAEVNVNFLLICLFCQREEKREANSI